MQKQFASKDCTNIVNLLDFIVNSVYFCTLIKLTLRTEASI